MSKRKAAALSIIIAILILVAGIGCEAWIDYTTVRPHPAPFAPSPENIKWSKDYDGGGGINYDPECYPNDYRGIKPSERDAYFATQTATAP